MDKKEILEQVDAGPGLAIIATELDLIEGFASANWVPDEWHLADAFREQGFVLNPNCKHRDGRAKFIVGTLPAGWRCQLNKEWDWRIDLLDEKGHCRGYFKYEPWDYADTHFFQRFERRWSPAEGMPDTAAKWTIWNNREQGEEPV